MDYYYKEFEKLQEEFHETMHHYPIFFEMIQKIQERDIKEINELLDKNDEFYLKQANSKLKSLIEYIKKSNESITREYNKFDKLASEWEKITIVNASERELDRINNQVRKSNELIKSHHLKDIEEANKILETLIKENR